MVDHNGRRSTMAADGFPNKQTLTETHKHLCRSGKTELS